MLLCCFMTDIKLKKVQYIHPYIVQEKSRPVRTFPFGIYSLLFSLSFILSFMLSRFSYFLSVFPKHIVLFHSLLRETQKLKYPNATLSVISKKDFLLIRPYKIKAVPGVLRIWVTTAPVMTYARVTTQTCVLL